MGIRKGVGVHIRETGTGPATGFVGPPLKMLGVQVEVIQQQQLDVQVLHGKVR